MQVEPLLLKTLENLVDPDLRQFHFFCTLETLDGRKPFPRSRLQNASREDTAFALADTYKEKAVSVTVEILKKMSKNGLAEDLENEYAALSTSSSAQSPTAAAAAGAPGAPGAPGSSMMAQQQSMIFAPTFTNSTAGSLNIHFNHPNNN